MKKLRSLSLAVASLSAISSTHAATFDDVQFWAGSGANRAAVVIDWNDGKSSESLVWGYRWDGASTGFDMLLAVVQADARLYGHFGNYAWGSAVHGLGYDSNGNGSFAVTPTLNFDSLGVVTTTSPDDLRAAGEATDHYIEGWNNGFWAYFIKGNSGEAWTSPMFGASGRTLTDGAWDGYSFAPNFSGPNPGEPMSAPVPEPSAFALALVSFALMRARQTLVARAA